MNPLLKNILAVLAGVIAGSVVNSLIVNFGPYVIPLPEGADVSTMDGLRESMELFTAVNFIPPFLGHALGTLIGAFVTAKLASTHVKQLVLGVGILFLAGGITAVVMLGGPLWFKVTDLLLAYIPMAYLGAVLAGRGVEDEG